MALIDSNSGTLTGKLVYFGPPESGKSTNLQMVWLRMAPSHRGPVNSIGPPEDRLIYFDCLPGDAGVIPGWTTRLRVCACPGRPSRQTVSALVESADAIAFVADSQLERLMENTSVREELAHLLSASGQDPRQTPMVFQWNKRDLPNAYPTHELVRILNPFGAPSFEAVASTCHGVYETFGQLTHLGLARLYQSYGPHQRARPDAPAKERINTARLTTSDLDRFRHDPASALGISAEDLSRSFLGHEGEPLLLDSEEVSVTRTIDPLLLPLDEPEEAPAEMPAQIGPYMIHQELGRGGMGVVYHGYDPSRRMDVALKIVNLDDRAEKLMPAALERFRREGEITARLEHPGIVRVLGSGEHEGAPYLAYELVEGCHSMTQAFRDQTLVRRVRLVADAARALGYAHKRGVVHRDIKPDNLLIDTNLTVKVADFGLALAMGMDRITKTGAFVGTPTHMSPEQFEGKEHDVGPETDVWALGVILYQAITERLPFRSRRIVELIPEILTNDPQPVEELNPRVPPGLQRACERALEKNPADRYPDAGALARDLDRMLRDPRGDSTAHGEPEDSPAGVAPPTFGRSVGHEDAWALQGGLPDDPQLAAEVREKALNARMLMGSYVLLETLNRELGTLHRAWDTEGRRQVFLHKLNVGFGWETESRRVLNSVRTLRKPHLNPLLSYDADDGTLYLVEAFRAGQLLSERRRSTKRTAFVIRDVAAALAAGGAGGLLHEGLHPGCVLIDVEGSGWVLGFGLTPALRLAASAAGADGPALPARYQAPECFGGQQSPGPSADVYAVGAVLYYGLTGQAPPVGKLPPPSQLSSGRVPQPLDEICLRCLRPAPADRFASAAELSAALSEFLER